MATPKRDKTNRELQPLAQQNIKVARSLWKNKLNSFNLAELKRLSDNTRLSISSGEILLLNGKWYVTHAGLLQIAVRRRCLGIRTVLQEALSDPTLGRWLFKATVYKSHSSKGFVGYGDADPSNVSPLVRGAEMRVAETRAVNRALRKAYGIGLCSVEELGWTPEPSSSQSSRNGSSAGRVNGNGHSAPPRLRDRLCLLIREHQLDPTLVKAYAADYCGTPALHNASREQVETFINHLTERATQDRAALLCHLNSFAKAQEVSS
jgi:hypothetical protein